MKLITAEVGASGKPKKAVARRKKSASNRHLHQQSESVSHEAPVMRKSASKSMDSLLQTTAAELAAPIAAKTTANGPSTSCGVANNATPPPEYRVLLMGSRHKRTLHEKLLASADKTEHHIQYLDIVYLYYNFNGECLVIELQDPGMEHTGAREMAIRKADAVILCYAAYNISSFHQLSSLADDFKLRKSGHYPPVLLIANEDELLEHNNSNGEENSDAVNNNNSSGNPNQSSSEGYHSADDFDEVEPSAAAVVTEASVPSTALQKRASMEKIRASHEESFRPISIEQGETMSKLFGPNCEFLSLSFAALQNVGHLVESLVRKIHAGASDGGGAAKKLHFANAGGSGTDAAGAANGASARKYHKRSPLLASIRRRRRSIPLPSLRLWGGGNSASASPKGSPKGAATPTTTPTNGGVASSTATTPKEYIDDCSSVVEEPSTTMLIDELTHSPKRSRSPNANALSNDGVDGKEGAIVDATKSKFDFCEDAIASLHISGGSIASAPTSPPMATTSNVSVMRNQHCDSSLPATPAAAMTVGRTSPQRRLNNRCDSIEDGGIVGGSNNNPMEHSAANKVLLAWNDELTTEPNDSHKAAEVEESAAVAVTEAATKKKQRLWGLRRKVTSSNASTAATAAIGAQQRHSTVCTIS